MRRILVVLALVVLCTLRVQAQPAQSGRATTILFVGNSYTHGKFDPVVSYRTGVVDENAGLPRSDPRFETSGGVPAGPFGGVAAIFKRFTEEVGLRYDVHVELLSGDALKAHYERALDIIKRPGWDVVVMQDLSTGPILETRAGSPQDFERYTQLLEQAVHATSPTAKIWLYETFPRADLTYPDGAPFAGKPITFMGNQLHDAYYAEVAREGHLAGVAPAGDAWLRAIASGVAEANPYAPESGKLDLWAVDHNHPSAWGAYLNACVIFETVTGRDPRALGGGERAAVDLSITRDQALTLQRLAHETVTHAP